MTKVSKPLLYVAGPYRDKRGAAYIEKNIRRAEEVAQQLWRAGFAVICPHANTRHFDGVAPDNAFLEGDLVMVERCDGIVMIPGWEKSKGAIGELNHAKENNVRVFLWEEELHRTALLQTATICATFGENLLSRNRSSAS